MAVLDLGMLAGRRRVQCPKLLGFGPVDLMRKEGTDLQDREYMYAEKLETYAMDTSNKTSYSAKFWKYSSSWERHGHIKTLSHLSQFMLSNPIS